ASALEQNLAPLLDAVPAGSEIAIPTSNPPSIFGFNRHPGYHPRIAAMPINPGILDRSIADLRDQAKNNALPSKTYIAIVEQSPEVQLGTTAAQPEESLHVIVGRW